MREGATGTRAPTDQPLGHPASWGPPQGSRAEDPPVLSPLLCPCDAPALSLSCHQEGPVEPETFLRAAVQGKMPVIEKFLADGGSPDTCDEVAVPHSH